MYTELNGGLALLLIAAGMAKRKAEDGPALQRNLVEIIPLGAGQEVGRSCIILKYMCALCDACCLPQASARFARQMFARSAASEQFASDLRCPSQPPGKAKHTQQSQDALGTLLVCGCLLLSTWHAEAPHCSNPLLSGGYIWLNASRGKTVMLDCGIHPGFSGMNALPFFDEIDLDTVDAMLVTHFHLDHCAAVPYVVGKTNFKAAPKHPRSEQAASSWLLSISAALGAAPCTCKYLFMRISKSSIKVRSKAAATSLL